MKRMKLFAVAALSAVTILSCSGDVATSSSPVELVTSYTPDISVVDISPTALNCAGSLGTVTMTVLPTRPVTDTTLLAVRVNRYRVSYRRLDGGTQVPAPYVRPMDVLIGLNQVSTATTFRLFEVGSLQQAPFAALLPQNGGRDPETQRTVVRLEVILELFGETLAGDNVYDSTRIPLEFCNNCGDCR